MNNEDQILMGNVQFRNRSPEDEELRRFLELDDCQITAGGPRNPGPSIGSLTVLPPGVSLYTPPEPPLPWDVPMTFRDFLRLKKEVLDAYAEWEEASTGGYHLIPNEDNPQMGTWTHRKGDPNTPWPEALKGLTREDIEILKQ